MSESAGPKPPSSAGGAPDAPQPLTPKEAARALRAELEGSPPTLPPAPADGPAPESDAATLIGKSLGQYQVLDKLGQGGMGTVFRAHDTSLDRTVALKVLFCGPLDEQKTAERFKREALCLARLSHPNLLHVYNVGSQDDLHYFAMEMLEGCTFSKFLRVRGRLPAQEFLPLAGQVLSALHYIHQQGITHRDIKGGNLMICGGRAVLMDFGLAKDDHFTGMTSVGCVLGTPEYMSPEQAEGFSYGPPTDLYSFGVVMYEALTGGTPFTGRSAMSILRQQMDTPPPRLETRLPGIDPRLAQAVHRCLAKRPEQRYPDCPALAKDLADIQSTPELLQVASADSSRATVVRPRPLLVQAPGVSPPGSRGVPGGDPQETVLSATGAAGSSLQVYGAAPGTTATGTALQAPAPPRARRRWIVAALAICLAALLLAWFWRAPRARVGGRVKLEGLAAASGREYRLVEFHAEGQDPNRWTWVLEWKKPDGAWQRETIVGQREFQRLQDAVPPEPKR